MFDCLLIQIALASRLKKDLDNLEDLDIISVIFVLFSWSEFLHLMVVGYLTLSLMYFCQGGHVIIDID